MNDTVVTVVGNVATGVEFRESASGGVARFRFAVTARRWDRLKNAWADGPTSFYTVWAWRTLGANLAASVSVGEPLVVHGRLRVREDEREGQRRVSADIDALAVGHDLTRGTSAFRRVARAAVSLTERHKATTQGQEGPLRERPRERHGPERHGREPFPESVAEPVAAGPAGGAGAVVPDRGGGMIPRAIPVA
ncbi:single-stranded DNA-binding protein [Streptomyces sp. GMY02]|uniref:single-stranded DNA-binding protein n=1 Tax=Streptomyces sp. GMY02 TaxID=1333528 RepID=UPI001C2C7318|nr:single-stranded DNA-binding protein [Streptomyces sp. GMY02]QXE36781.1 single-stranded DNA-binding protein [Streptomyces sp. GMY02]